MTGFGAATAETPAGRMAVEIRSFNHRFREVQVRLPRDLAALEDRVRALVQGRVHRGRVEVVVSRDEGARRPRAVRVDLELAGAYARALRELADGVGASGEVTLAQLAALPDVLRVEDDRTAADSLGPALEAAAAAAADALVEMRSAEGKRLAEYVLGRLDAIEGHVEAVAARSHEAVRLHGERLRLRLAEVLAEVPVDEARLANELALHAERSDISEEITRLRSHLGQARQAVTDEEGPVGRKLEFLLQEMGRETNTIGSKAGDLEIARAVIAMKTALEGLREQIQNIE